MSEVDKKGMSALKMVAGVILLVWFAGAFIAGIYHNIVDKHECIQNEGWVKGLLWCSNHPQSAFVGNMLRGVIWPIALITSPGTTAAPDSHSPRMTREEFGKSRTATAYVCWGIAMSTDRHEHSETLSKFILGMGKRIPNYEQTHMDFIYHAGQVIEEFESKGLTEEYYIDTCVALASRVKSAIAQGMLPGA